MLKHTLILCALLASPSFSQTERRANNNGVKVIEFAQESLVMEAVGLSLPIPVGAAYEQTKVANQSSTKIYDEKRTWQVTVQTPVPKDPDVTSEDLIQAVVISLLEQAGAVYDATDITGRELLVPDGESPESRKLANSPKLTGYRAHIIEPLKSVVTAGETPAQRIYLKLPAEGVKNPTTFVRGYCVLKSSPSQFISFELITPESEFVRTKPIFEAMLAAANIEDPTLVQAERKSAIESGEAALAKMDRSAMEGILAGLGDQWQRLYMPSETGLLADDKEIGYRRITARVGDGPLKSSTNQKGYIVQIDARIILDDNLVADSQGVYFMSFDRSRENWTLTNTIRDLNPETSKRKPARTSRELGARDNKSFSIRTEGPGGDADADTIRPLIEGPGYISQLEAILLPNILVKSGFNADFAFYSYRPDFREILFRKDSVSIPENQPGRRTITSRIAKNGMEQVTTLTDGGEFIQTRLPDGKIWEPVTFEKLKRIWRDKQLPTE